MLLCLSLVSFVAFVLSLFGPHLFLFRCLGKAVLRNCGIYWASFFIFICMLLRGTYGVKLFLKLISVDILSIFFAFIL